MTALFVPTCIALLVALATPSFAQQEAAPARAHAHDPAAAKPVDVSATAAPAAAVVDAFSAALTKGDLKKVETILDPSVVILEAGGAEHSRAEYLGGHAKSDAEFLRSAHSVLLRRMARAEGNIAWVASEHERHVTREGKAVTLLSAETMVLRKTAAGWLIVHIHWSSKEKRTT